MEYPARKDLRLRTWDYGSGGTYFLTFCTAAHRCLLSRIRRGDLYGRPPLVLTALGECTAQAIRERVTAGIHLYCQVIMPNHVHLLISLEPGARVGRLIGAIKSRTVFLARQQSLDAAALWQRGYHDHIVRDQHDFLRIWTYIDTNPQKWELDRYYTKR